ncbi:ROK family protein [Clostridium frigidicarnis]|uniref:Glucokinase n=1 Tax=Clostridium frigidicarnis TaxID=84698 RepID=A0A1I1AFX9_9CLOT|nr:ROK family protein [Clostridium frigidicarnis]SFB36904.1 glucokinase [Clostridium frigidicarnis]
MGNYVIGIDLGGTKIHGALADIEGNVISSQIVPTEASEGSEAVLDRIIGVIEKVLETSNKTIEDIKCIGFGSPGPLDAKNGIIVDSSNLPFKNFNLIKPIKSKFNVPIYLDNDANVATIGEFMFGAGKGTENMVYMTVSTGIGGGAIINGKLFRGNTSNALEIGHTTILPEGPQCNCGNHGCLESLASGTAIGKRAIEAVESGLDTNLSKYEKVSSYEVFVEAKNGDEVSRDILHRSLTYLGIGVANVINTFDPELIVIGGGVSKGGQVVFDRINEVVKERALKAMADSCRIVPAGLGSDAGVMGAVALAILESK